MEKVRLRYKLEFDIEVELGEGGFEGIDDPHEAAALEERLFAEMPDDYLNMLPDNAKFTVEP